MRLAVLALALSLPAAGCATAPRPPAAACAPAPAVPDRAASASAVLLGEHHDDEAHHRWQLDTLRGLLARNRRLAVGLEMVPRRLQPALDRWFAGELDEEAFLAAVEWDTVWGFPAAFYLPVLRLAREHRLPLVALNVDRALVSRTAREGWSAIPAAEREGVGDPAPLPAAYVAELRAAMAGHGGAADPARFARFVEAQSVWDRAMAERIADTHRATGRTVVALVGMTHAEAGMPPQLAALGLPDAVVLTPPHCP